MFTAIAFGIGIAAASVTQAAPAIEHWTAASGARVYFIESRGLPILDVSIEFPAGSARDRREQAGLAQLTLALLPAGTADIPESELSAQFADAGAQIGRSFDRDRSGLTLRTLSSHAEREKNLQLFARMLQQPVFPRAAVERERIRMMASVRDSLTRPDSLAERRFYAAAYANHPYGNLSTEDSLKEIDRAAVERFYQDHYAAGQAAVAIVGDVSRAEAAGIAEQLTADLPRHAAGTVIAPLTPANAAVSFAVAHPAAQSHVLIGIPALSRIDPEYFPLVVGNHVLGGGGFVSRLYREVRERRGYAYSVYSYFLPLGAPGPFLLGLQTRKAESRLAIARAREVLEEFVAKGPTEAELNVARKSLSGGFPLRIDSNRKLLDQLAVIGFYRLPVTWLEDYSGHIKRVSTADVRRAFKRIDLSKLVTVIVGAPE
ncbi:MAG: insulinase family protein [Betaproteobacteria bacterium]|nr:insulinase family protein [Betaproteobacteria bacterium]